MTNPASNLHPFSPEAIARRTLFAGWTMDGEGEGGAEAAAAAAAGAEAEAAAAAEADAAAAAAAEGEGEDARVKRANADAARYRTELRALQAKAEQDSGVLDALRKALDPNAKDGDDPTVQVTELTGRVEKLTSDNTSLRAELLVHTLASDNGGNPVSLLDSRGFLTTLQGLDPEGENYRTEVADAIKAAVKANASLAAAGQAPSRGGAAGAGAGSSQPDGAVTQEQFDAMGIAERSALHRTNPDLYRRLAANIR